MGKHPIRLLSKEQSEQLHKLAERARASLSDFSGVEVEYDVIGLQMLDEWIDRHMRQFPKPTKEMATIWGAFLGEVFIERLNGAWVVAHTQGKSRLGVLCPRERRGMVFVDVMEQVRRRIREGMEASLAFFYTTKAIEIKGG